MNNSLTYHEENGLLIPNLVMPQTPELGYYARLRLKYLMDHQEIDYTMLLTTGRLNDHLQTIQRQSEEMSDQLMAQMAKNEGITEALKRRNPSEWIGAMNNLKSRVKEIVLNELIYPEEAI